MTTESRNPFHLWEELKQRKVVRVITVYAASAFALLEAVDMIFPRLGFPSWTVTLVMILLACGLVIAVVLAWIYDITPEGIRKTKDTGHEIIEPVKGGETGTAGGNLILIPDSDELIKEKKIFAEKINKYKRKEKIYSLSSLIVIMAVILLFLFSSGKTVPFTKSDWIVISDFENLTEQPVFDKSLYTAFSLTINQSRHINVFPRNRIIETLARMQLKDTGYLDEKTGKEIAAREGINILIAPSISEIGNKFVITAKIIEASTGNLLKSVILEAENQDRILQELDRLSRKIRRDLGESRYRIALQDKPLMKVTTSSLEALKQYSLGIENHYRFNFEAAKTYYENALRIDTGFISAKASLGNILIQHFNDEKGKDLIGQAIRSVDKLTVKEKYNILSSYAVNVERDFKKGIENTRILTNLYPGDPAYHHNLGYYFQVDGQFENAMKEYKAAVLVNPQQALSFGGMLWIYLEKLGEPDSALVWSRKMISFHPQNAWGYFYLGSAFACLDSLDMALKSFLKAREIDPYFIMNQYRLSHIYHSMHLNKEAINMLERITELNKNEIPPFYDIGLNYQAMGDSSRARKYFKMFLEIAQKEWLSKYPGLASTYISSGIVLSRLNDTISSREMLQKALSIDTTLHDRYAEFFCQMGRIPDAIGQIEKALDRGYRDLYSLKLNPDLRALQNEPRFRALLNHYFNL